MLQVWLGGERERERENDPKAFFCSPILHIQLESAAERPCPRHFLCQVHCPRCQLSSQDSTQVRLGCPTQSPLSPPPPTWATSCPCCPVTPLTLPGPLAEAESSHTEAPRRVWHLPRLRPLMDGGLSTVSRREAAGPAPFPCPHCQLPGRCESERRGRKGL